MYQTFKFYASMNLTRKMARHLQLELMCEGLVFTYIPSYVSAHVRQSIPQYYLHQPTFIVAPMAWTHHKENYVTHTIITKLS